MSDKWEIDVVRASADKLILTTKKNGKEVDVKVVKVNKNGKLCLN